MIGGNSIGLFRIQGSVSLCRICMTIPDSDESEGASQNSEMASTISESSAVRIAVELGHRHGCVVGVEVSPSSELF